MSAEMDVISPNQGQFAERLLCARHGSRHWGTPVGKTGLQARETPFRGTQEWYGAWQPEGTRDPCPAAGLQSPGPQILVQLVPLRREGPELPEEFLQMQGSAPWTAQLIGLPGVDARLLTAPLAMPQFPRGCCT